MTNTVLVTDHDFDDLSIERSVLGDIAEVVDCSDSDDIRAEIVERTPAGVDAIINLRDELDADAIAVMDDVQVISRYGIGVDNIDIESATERNIPVTNVPDYCLEEVATHALALMLSMARNIPQYNRSVGSDEWDRAVGTPIHRFSTQTVGIVGYGAIGREVGARIAALGTDVLACDPFLSADDLADNPAALVEFETLLDRSDYVTIHSPLTDGTRGLFDAKAFTRMKDSAFIINVARGPIVENDALVAALDNGEIAGAGVDVFPEEPPAANNPLRGHDRVVITPHVAWYSEEANEERRHTVVEIIAAVLSDGKPWNVVNGVK